MTDDLKIRALIVDDEPLGRTMVRRMLEAHREVEIVGEAASGEEAVAVIERDQPDLIFLDVQMPEIDGFAVLENAKMKQRQPAVIFVTAYDEYAVRAFEVNALDYLLKPYDRKRFEQAFRRAVEQIQNRKNNRVGEQILSLLSETKSAEQFVERFIIKTGGRIFFLKTEEVAWIEAEGNYVSLHTGQKKFIFREAISNLEQKLNPHKFRRVNRSAIVNLDFIRELQPWFRGEFKILLQNGTELKLSRSFRQNLSKYFGGSL